MVVRGLDLVDSGNLENALTGGPEVPARASFDARWQTLLASRFVEDRENDFGARFLQTEATIAWRATRPGFRFVSDPAATSRTVFAAIGRERNGVFFPRS
jgi:hypothetical protein